MRVRTAEYVHAITMPQTRQKLNNPSAKRFYAHVLVDKQQQAEAYPAHPKAASDSKLGPIAGSAVSFNDSTTVAVVVVVIVIVFIVVIVIVDNVVVVAIKMEMIAHPVIADPSILAFAT
jgi:hypothetical protein